MDAMIMAGGIGSRLGLGEKACVLVNKKYLIDYIINSLLKSSFIKKIFVSVTQNTPNTKQYIINKYPFIEVVDTSSGNYVTDMVQSVKKSNSKDPIMIIMCDLPLINESLIDNII